MANNRQKLESMMQGFYDIRNDYNTLSVNLQKRVMAVDATARLNSADSTSDLGDFANGFMNLNKFMSEFRTKQNVCKLAKEFKDGVGQTFIRFDQVANKFIAFVEYNSIDLDIQCFKLVAASDAQFSVALQTSLGSLCTTQSSYADLASAIVPLPTIESICGSQD